MERLSGPEFDALARRLHDKYRESDLWFIRQAQRQKINPGDGVAALPGAAAMHLLESIAVVGFPKAGETIETIATRIISELYKANEQNLIEIMMHGVKETGSGH